MSMADLLQNLTKRGVRFCLSNGEIRYKAPAGILIEEVKQKLRERREEIIRWLSQQTKEAQPVVFDGRRRCCEST